MSIAALIASMTDSVLYGLTRIASFSSSAAPANSLSTRTPSLCKRDATYSFATRFIPSRNGVTIITSAAEYNAETSSSENDRCTRCTGSDRGLPNVAFIRPTASFSCRRKPAYDSMRSRDGNATWMKRILLASEGSDCSSRSIAWIRRGRPFV